MTTQFFTRARLLEAPRTPGGHPLAAPGPSGFTEPTTLAARDGRILATGEAAEAHRGRVPAGASATDLGGAFVLPGFVESHGHPTSFGSSLLDVDVRPGVAPSVDAICKAVAERVASVEPGEWVLGRGWDETALPEGLYPTKADLDAVAPDNPVVLTRTCGHMYACNSAAFAVSGITEDVEDPAGGRFVRDAAGRLTGLVQEDAKTFIAKPDPSTADLERGFALAQDRFTAWGVTTVNDLIATPAAMRMYTRMNASGDLRVRLRPWLYAVALAGYPAMLEAAIGAGMSSGVGDDMVRLQGMKYQLDGAMGGRTAPVSCPFHGSEDDHGILTHDTAKLVDSFRTSAQAGLRMAIHAIGDAAIEQAFDALAASGELDWVKENRIRIEHASFPTADHIARMAEWNVIASSSISFIHHLGDSYAQALGPDRVARVFPHRSYLDAGVVSVGNSDIPVTNGNPWEGIHGAVTRRTRTGQVLGAAEAITTAEAIDLYTRQAAFANCEEDRAGALAPGMFADLQVYEENPIALGDTDPDALLELAPESVFLAGKQVA
ncbi:amidohydrolase [Brevibacterium samyangense]|uniref:Amidohydrolase n=1 Tax=Brevibacterium samyangense TaxID=366888 RepID=A0ABP5EL04_9MICO